MTQLNKNYINDKKLTMLKCSNLYITLEVKCAITFMKYAVNFNRIKNEVFKRFNIFIEYSRNCYGSH